MITGIEQILNHKTPLIREMKMNQEGWMIPWMSCITKNGDVYVDGTYRIDIDGRGTTSLYIKKTEEGYDLDFKNVESYDDFVNTLQEKVSHVNGSKLEDWIKVGNITKEFQRSLVQ